MPKGVKNGPQHLRLISRNEAAAILGCTSIVRIANQRKAKEIVLDLKQAASPENEDE